MILINQSADVSCYYKCLAMLRDWEDTEMRVFQLDAGGSGGEMEVGLRVFLVGAKVTALEYGRVGKGHRERCRLWRPSPQSAWQGASEPRLLKRRTEMGSNGQVLALPLPQGSY